MVLVHQPHHADDGSNNLDEFVIVCLFATVSLVVHRTSKDNQSVVKSVQLDRIKTNHQRDTLVEPGYKQIDQVSLGAKKAGPDLDKENTAVCITSLLPKPPRCVVRTHHNIYDMASGPQSHKNVIFEAALSLANVPRDKKSRYERCVPKAQSNPTFIFEKNVSRGLPP